MSTRVLITLFSAASASDSRHSTALCADTMSALCEMIVGSRRSCAPCAIACAVDSAVCFWIVRIACSTVSVSASESAFPRAPKNACTPARISSFSGGVFSTVCCTEASKAEFTLEMSKRCSCVFGLGFVLSMGWRCKVTVPDPGVLCGAQMPDARPRENVVTSLSPPAEPPAVVVPGGGGVVRSAGSGCAPKAAATAACRAESWPPCAVSLEGDAADAVMGSMMLSSSFFLSF